MGKGKAARLRYIQNFRDFSIPIPWSDFVYIITRHFAFEMDEKPGSSARAFTIGDETFIAYEPHGKKRGDKNVRKDDRIKAIRALLRLGIFTEE